MKRINKEWLLEPEPICEDCGEYPCVCEPREEEPEIECPGSVCWDCEQAGGWCICELKEMIEEEDREGEDHD